MKSLKEFLTSNSKIKGFVHHLIISDTGSCPRLWVKCFVNPVYFFNKRGSGSKIRRHTVMNISPINQFRLGAKSVIEYFSLVDNAVGDVIIGSGTRVGLGNTIIGPVEIGNDTILAQNIVVSALNHNYENPNLEIKNQGISKEKITIGNGTWIGANSVITAGVSIGNHCVVAGGAVVVKNIPDYCVAVGNPARIIKRYDFDQKQWIKV